MFTGWAALYLYLLTLNENVSSFEFFVRNSHPRERKMKCIVLNIDTNLLGYLPTRYNSIRTSKTLLRDKSISDAMLKANMYIRIFRQLL